MDMNINVIYRLLTVNVIYGIMGSGLWVINGYKYGVSINGGTPKWMVYKATPY